MPFRVAVREYMTTEVVSVPSTAHLDDVNRLLDHHGFSSVPVLGPFRQPVGVLSRTDLLRIGRRQAGSRTDAKLMVLPKATASEVMTAGVKACSPDTPLCAAAHQMIDEKLHRLYVIENDHIIGVISTLDLTRAVRDARTDARLSTVMTQPLITVDAWTPISIAVDHLASAAISTLVVLDEAWPVGVFGQVEALASKELPRSTPVDQIMDMSMLCMPSDSRLHRAAAQAAALDARRVIACRNREAVGMVSGMDFARVVATA